MQRLMKRTTLKHLKNLKNRANSLTLLTIIQVLPSITWASQTGTYEWETTLTSLADSLTGPVAYAISIMAIFVAGMTMAFMDLQGGAKKLVQAALGLSVALFSSQIITGFMGFSGAVI